VETSVLVACSVHAVIDQLGVVEDQFYKICIPLFKIFQKYIEKRIGITTFTVEEEARSVLNSVVLRRLNEKMEENPEIRKDINFFTVYSTILDICSDNLTKNCSMLLREPIPTEQKNELVLKVAAMYKEIKELDFFEILKSKPRPISHRLKILAEKIYESETKKRIAPILEFMERKPPSLKDYEILAEAAYLAQSYGSNVSFFMASTDQHMAPFRREEKIISNHIKKQLNVVCDWPDIIAEKIQGLI